MPNTEPNSTNPKSKTQTQTKPKTKPKIVDVVVAVIQQQEQVLISKRAKNVHCGGVWEFPGGKIEAGETHFHALQRELKEELGIEIQQCQPLMSLPFCYPDKQLKLFVYTVMEYQGQAQACEGQPLIWVDIANLNQYAFPEANQAIINRLQLLPYYVITGENPQNPVEFLTKLEQVLQQGYKLIQFRAKALSQKQYVKLADNVIELAHSYQAKVLCNLSLDIWHEFAGKADGLHLTSSQLMALNSRPTDLLLAASCHNQAQIQQAKQLGVDFIVVSPVAQTKHYTSSQLLGWQGFAELVRYANMPVFALGGVKPNQLDTCVQVGGYGIAGISGFWDIASDNN